MPPPPPGSAAKSVDKGHGRLERRSIRVTTTLTKAQEFKGLRQGFELTRERTAKGGTTVEVAYGITSLGPERADAARLLGLARGHWGIENGLHHRRDVTMGEDASRVRKGSAPQAMAALRNGVIGALAGLKGGLASAIRRMGNCLDQALSLLGISQDQ